MIFTLDAFESVRETHPEFYAAVMSYQTFPGPTLVASLIDIPPQALLDLQHKYLGIGLGDIVHLAAHPIATAIDYLAGTDLQNCGGCAERQAILNLPN
jgi:hypothetical protein